MKKRKKLRRLLFTILHLNYIIGLVYALVHFLITPKITMFTRRLWAYEVWIILSFYLLFFYLTILEEEKEKRRKRIKAYATKMRKILSINLFLLILPWGLFLVLSPRFLLSGLGLGSIYWRVLGLMSLLGALIYTFPYFFYRKKLSYYIYLFGMIDNFLAGLIIMILFILNRVPLIAIGSIPLLFYFSFFFLNQSRRYRHLFKEFFS